MLYGYIRVSTKTQEHGTSLEDQKRILTQHGCQKLFQDIQSGSTMERRCEIFSVNSDLL